MRYCITIDIATLNITLNCRNNNSGEVEMELSPPNSTILGNPAAMLNTSMLPVEVFDDKGKSLL